MIVLSNRVSVKNAFPRVGVEIRGIDEFEINKDEVSRKARKDWN
jgi:hypothetical protein